MSTADEDLILAKEHLRQMGHDVGETHIVYQGAVGTIQVSMDGALFTRDEILRIAEEEQGEPRRPN
jgi:phage terminase large subunit-like protein